ncbi:hypothetical protein Ciccas_012205 [Cichlidogyrus casuarinus]|uniref:Uncharacterized protein n=1 Tax=Cichlidogyrus casuarinus TaxID=1844966 RepID=A0ABD2PPU2_9PLAT
MVDYEDVLNYELCSASLLSLSPQIFKFTYLEEIDFSSNSIEHIPEDLSSFKFLKSANFSLKQLDLSHNSIHSVIGKVEWTNNTLKTLDLSFNELENIPNFLMDLLVLEDIQLECNQFRIRRHSLASLYELKIASTC